MARLLGIDYGEKRIGLAVTDPLQLIASPFKTLCPRSIFSFLESYLQQEKVEGIVVGRPVGLEGKQVRMSVKVDQFVLAMQKRFNVQVFTIDERFTSLMAKQSRLEAGYRKKARQNKAAIDAVSAALILRSFLSYKEAKS